MKSKSTGRGASAASRAGHAAKTNIFEQMMENSPLNFMRADTDLIIRYINPASRATLTRLAQLLPCRVEDVVGSSVDIFHKNPAHQRRMLADPKNLPHRADIPAGTGDAKPERERDLRRREELRGRDARLGGGQRKGESGGGQQWPGGSDWEVASGN